MADKKLFAIFISSTLLTGKPNFLFSSARALLSHRLSE